MATSYLSSLSCRGKEVWGDGQDLTVCTQVPVPIPEESYLGTAWTSPRLLGVCVQVVYVPAGARARMGGLDWANRRGG